MSSLTISADSALLIVDVQQGFELGDWGEPYHPDAESNIARLLSAWRTAGRPVLHAQHLSRSPESPLHPDKPGSAIKPEVAPEEGEPLFQKRVNSAFIGTDLEAHLRKEGIDSLVIVGFTTNHCVSTTARMAENLGFDTTVVGDATVAFGAEGPGGRHHPAEQVHAVSLANLQGEFASVVSTDEVLAAL